MAKPPIHITSPDNARIKAVAKLRDGRQRRKTGLFAVQSVRELDRALRAGLSLRELYVCPDVLKHALPEAVIGPADAAGAAARFTVTANVLAKMALREHPEGVVAVLEQRRWQVTDLPAPSPDRQDLLLLAVGIEKPGNLGAMARTVAAAGGTALLVVDGVADIYNPSAIRNATGAVFTLPIISLNFAETLNLLQARQTSLIAARPDATTVYTQANLTGPVALAIGPEDTGLDERWRQAVRQIGGEEVSIPMPGVRGGSAAVDSLNAATSAAVLLFEAVRQRTGGRSSG